MRYLCVQIDKKSMAKILITGGTGYIGSHTAIELLQNTQYEVISIDNFVNSSPETVQRVSEITGKNWKNYPIDLCDFAATKQVFAENPDITGIIHFAAFKSVGESVEFPLNYYANNVISLINILRLCEEFGVKNVVFSSSCSVYGNIEKMPVTEETPIAKAECPYANTKVIGEQMIHDFVKNNDIHAVILRYFNPVGAHISAKIGENPINKPNNLVPVITQTAIGKIPKLRVFGGDYPTRDGSCVRDYIHVSDIANAHTKAIDFLQARKGQHQVETFNLGTGEGITVLEAIQAFETVSGQKLNYEIGARRAGDVVTIYADCTKSMQVLGWQPQYGILEMMQTAWKWEQFLAK